MVRDVLAVTLPDSYWVDAELSEVREAYGRTLLYGADRERCSEQYANS